MNPQPNDPAPDATLLDMDGQLVPLAGVWRNGQTALLVFLRHLG